MGGRRSWVVKGSVHENVMFPPAAVRPSVRLKAGPGKPGHWRTPRVTGGSLLEQSRPQVVRKRASTRTSGVLRGQLNDEQTHLERPYFWIRYGTRRL
jgi:hypothetical protein